jgi:hypothetical protein
VVELAGSTAPVWIQNLSDREIAGLATNCSGYFLSCNGNREEHKHRVKKIVKMVRFKLSRYCRHLKNVYSIY